jgi:purine-nucleoside phosphorylase
MFIDDLDPRHAIREGASRLRTLWSQPIHAAVVAGSGFSTITEAGSIIDRLPYSHLTGLPNSAVNGHGSEVVLLSTSAGTIMVFTGRAHAYEGHRPSVCASHVAVARECGVKNILLTNACGGLHPRLRTGDIVIPTSTLNLTHRSVTSPTISSDSPRSAYLDLSDRMIDACWSKGLPVRAGVYAQVLGPSYETRAEIRMLRRIGADTVGMSTAVEALWASRMGAHVGIISLVTNTLTDATYRTVTHGEVVHAAEMSHQFVSKVVLAAVESARTTLGAP